ncbi:type I-E CRISPR-associated protein Cas5/CasD [Lactobacillus sp.]|uniref:type I-E CRISPR-associated protein Cas5/CasD n=1 Tax=Lactobacillus sp. TaxID=1591 RepID=UPI00199834CF|nr:type I-E CRISPR-associated protein Cas5/CasD [Lactobacillus sp.]MBD5430105.1 type I-E CRISPR-associated protein Cas5/CasD [Lactobacillus sp.]MBD5430585.1 type I-E CRISPR-associated protein Cas5/CasD [Lactobacillus sp.]
MKTATIRLTAPLQSYGNQADFNQRTTNYYPTKSAIIGMVAAALGYQRDNSRIEELNKLLVAVRIEQPSKMMTEFQTVEYHKSSTKTARKLTYRQFLQDAVFVVAIGSNDNQAIDQLINALKHPKFQLYLGRRSNPPAGPLKVDDFQDKNPIQVLEDLPWQASKWYQKKFPKKEFTAKIIADAVLIPDGKVIFTKDKVGSFNQKDRYHKYRAITEKKVQLENLEYEQEKHFRSDLDYWSAI